MVVGTLATVACLAPISSTSANETRPKTAAVRSQKPIKTVAGAVARLGRELREGKPVQIEDRFDVIQTIADRNVENGLASCVIRRAVIKSVSGKRNYFALFIKKPKMDQINATSVKIIPLGGVDETDRIPSPERGLYVIDGTFLNTKAIVELKDGILGTSTTETLAAAAAQDRQWSPRERFPQIGRQIC
jgi:hypothetical protein